MMNFEKLGFVSAFRGKGWIPIGICKIRLDPDSHTTNADKTSHVIPKEYVLL